MPVEIVVEGTKQSVFPTEKWQSVPSRDSSLVVDEDYFVQVKKLK
jgi:hypothetical protein